MSTLSVASMILNLVIVIGGFVFFMTKAILKESKNNSTIHGKN